MPHNPVASMLAEPLRQKGIEGQGPQGFLGRKGLLNDMISEFKLAMGVKLPFFCVMTES